MLKIVGACALCILSVSAQAAPPGYFDLRPGVTLETGDSWFQDGARYRLYGVQSCLRGTFYTDKSGEKRDCGEASLAVFAAYVKDTSPACAPVVKTTDLTYVICFAVVGEKQLDLGSVMIGSGFAFAALDVQGRPLYPAYGLTEQEARGQRAGLWAFEDVQHPALLLSKAAKGSSEKQ